MVYDRKSGERDQIGERKENAIYLKEPENDERQQIENTTTSITNKAGRMTILLRMILIWNTI